MMKDHRTEIPSDLFGQSYQNANLLEIKLAQILQRVESPYKHRQHRVFTSQSFGKKKRVTIARYYINEATRLKNCPELLAASAESRTGPTNDSLLSFIKAKNIQKSLDFSRALMNFV